MKRLLKIGVSGVLAAIVGCQSCPKQTCLPVIATPPCQTPVGFTPAPVFEPAQPILAQPRPAPASAVPAPKQILPAPTLQPTTQGFQQQQAPPKEEIKIVPERLARK